MSSILSKHKVCIHPPPVPRAKAAPTRLFLASKETGTAVAAARGAVLAVERAAAQVPRTDLESLYTNEAADLGLGPKAITTIVKPIGVGHGDVTPTTMRTIGTLQSCGNIFRLLRQLQCGSSGCKPPFVDNKTKVPSQYRVPIQ